MLAIIQPEFVLCGGDLTDAKARNDLVSEGQIVSEWEIYQEITNTRWNKVPWLDIRGNHDTYGVLSTSSSQNYFANYSVMGRQGHLSSYNQGSSIMTSTHTSQSRHGLYWDFTYTY